MTMLLNPFVLAPAFTAVANLVDNGTFDDASEWTITGTGLSITGGELVWVPGAGNRIASQTSNETLVTGESLYYSFDLGGGGGPAALYAGRSAPNSGGTLLRSTAINGPNSGVVNSVTATGQLIACVGAGGSDATIDNLVVKKALQNLTPTASSIAEDATIGATVLTPSRGRSGSMFSLSNDAGGKFAINPSTGVVTVAAGLDYETATSHAITIRETNAAYPNSPRDTNATINVTNVFDGTPGTELNPDVTMNNTGLWTFSSASLNANRLLISANGSAKIQLGDDIAQNDVVRITYDLVSLVANETVVISAGEQTIASFTTLFNTPSPGTFTAEAKVASAPSAPEKRSLLITGTGTGEVILDNISVKKITFP